MKIVFILLVLLVVSNGCQTEQVVDNKKVTAQQEEKAAEEERGMPLPAHVGKIFTENDKKYMYGGKDSTWNFDVTNGVLIDTQYHYGIGREAFHALIAPEFMTAEEANLVFADTADFLFLQIGEEKRAYSIELLTHHEIVNDIVNGEPVMAAYCILADLGAVYERTYADKVLTFGLSGYTYYDPEVWDGVDGFVFWDRETESTWWPLIGKGVSGPMLDVPLKEYNEDNWEKMTWEEIKVAHPDVLVLKRDQTMDPPAEWVKYDSLTIENIKSQL